MESNGHGDAALHTIKFRRHFHFEYNHPDGTHWEADIDNLTPDAWLTKTLDIAYRAQTAPANFFVGLIGTSHTYAAGDTYSSHAGWTEVTPYSDATRPAWTPASASAKSITNTASKARFNINATATVNGAFLCTNSTKGDSTANAANILCGEGDFSQGAQSVSSGGTLDVTITVTAS